MSCAVFLARAEVIGAVAFRLAGGVAGATGTMLLRQAELTIRGVALAVTATAGIKRVISGIGLIAAGTPWANAVLSIVFMACLLGLGASVVMVPCCPVDVFFLWTRTGPDPWAVHARHPAARQFSPAVSM